MKPSLGKQSSSFFRAHAFALVWALVILVLCVMPGDALPDINFWELNLEDKLAHMAVFGLLAVLLVYGEQRRMGTLALPWSSYFVIVSIGVLYGVLTEALQATPLVASRYATLGDVVADSLGSILGTIVAPVLLKWTGLNRSLAPR